MPDGSANPDPFLQKVVEASKPNVGDLLYAGQRQRTRIIERTLHGLDINNQPFEPYSENGPYYYYPGKSAKNRKAAVDRFAKKLNVGGKKTSTGLGIKFDSYGDFKRSLGRTVVDLFGARAPHMLQAIFVRVGGITIYGAADSATGNAPATQIVMGIYGEKAEIAEKHQTGDPANNLPKREFFGVTADDNKKMLEDISARALRRVQRLLGGGQ